MTKKQARGQVNRIASILKELTDINPDCLEHMTIYIHRIPEDNIPSGFVPKPLQFAKDTREHRELKEELSIDFTIFTK